MEGDCYMGGQFPAGVLFRKLCLSLVFSQEFSRLDLRWVDVEQVDPQAIEDRLVTIPRQLPDY